MSRFIHGIGSSMNYTVTGTPSPKAVALLLDSVLRFLVERELEEALPAQPVGIEADETVSSDISLQQPARVG